ncbi:MAG: hypothetical protein LBK82_12435 [Planctomycetaceae bacterium]|jgi:hypothetical protein|nr:hypothetical protein [Planctomycetaceae bacterium]
MRYLIFTLLLLPIVIGCNSNNNPQGRVAVRGEVTLDGKLLPFGNITFSSLPGLTPVIATGATIKNGKFSLSTEHGLVPEQEYLVQFRAVEEIPGARKTNNPRERVPTHNLIPQKYGTKSKETVTTTKKSPNVFQFDLTSDK